MDEPLSSAPDPEEVPLRTAGPVRADEDAWTVGQWKGLPNYECRDCPFSTLDLPVMEEHRKESHGSALAPEARSKRRYIRRE